MFCNPLVCPHPLKIFDYLKKRTVMLIQSSQPGIDSLKSLIRAEVLRYHTAIDNDRPFSETRKIKKNINKLHQMLLEQEQREFRDFVIS
jgi:hypothetical protein